MRGDASAMCNLGCMYSQGLGVEQDHCEAMKWYRKSAAKGDRIAIYNIGDNHVDGHCVPRDYREALKWMERAAELGWEPAQRRLPDLRAWVATNQAETSTAGEPAP